MKDRHSHRIQLDSKNTYHHLTMVRQCLLIVICVLFTLCLPKRLRSLLYIFIYLSPRTSSKILFVYHWHAIDGMPQYIPICILQVVEWLVIFVKRYVCKDKIITHWDISRVIGMIEWSFPFVCCLVLKTSNSVNSSAAGMVMICNHRPTRLKTNNGTDTEICRLEIAKNIPHATWIEK